MRTTRPDCVSRNTKKLIWLGNLRNCKCFTSFSKTKDSPKHTYKIPGGEKNSMNHEISCQSYPHQKNTDMRLCLSFRLYTTWFQTLSIKIITALHPHRVACPVSKAISSYITNVLATHTNMQQFWTQFSQYILTWHGRHLNWIKRMWKLEQISFLVKANRILEL